MLVSSTNSFGALRNEAAYVNVHSSLHGPGEIRGQIKFDDKRGDDEFRF